MDAEWVCKVSVSPSREGHSLSSEVRPPHQPSPPWPTQLHPTSSQPEYSRPLLPRHVNELTSYHSSLKPCFLHPPNISGFSPALPLDPSGPHFPPQPFLFVVSQPLHQHFVFHISRPQPCAPTVPLAISSHISFLPRVDIPCHSAPSEAVACHGVPLSSHHVACLRVGRGGRVEKRRKGGMS